MDNMGKRRIKDWHIVVALFLFSFMIRYMYINTGLFHHDVVQQARLIESGEIFGIGLHYLRVGLLMINFVMFKIYAIITGNWSAEFIMNFSSVLFGALAIPVMYLFTKELTKKRFIAITSALFLSVTPVFLSISTYGKEHAMQVFFGLAALYVILLAARKNSNRLYILASALFGYFLLVREDSIIFIPLFLLLYFYPRYSKEAKYRISIAKEKLGTRRLAATFLPLIIIFLPQFIYNTIPRILHIFSGTDRGAGEFLGLYSYMFPIVLPILARTMTYLGLLFIIIGIYALIKRKEYFILIFLVGWSSVFFYYANNPIFSPRWLSIILPPMLIICAYGLDLFYEKKQKIMKSITSAFFVYLLITMFFTIHPLIKERHEVPLPKAFFQEWVSDSPEGSVLLIPPDSCVFAKYYTDRKCTGNQNFSNSVKIINSNIKEGIYTYYTVELPKASEPEDQILEFSIELVKRYNVDRMLKLDFEDFHKASINEKKYTFRLLEINPNNVPEDLMEKINSGKSKTNTGQVW